MVPPSPAYALKTGIEQTPLFQSPLNLWDGPLHSSDHNTQVQLATSSLACFFWTRMQAPWLEHEQPSCDHEVTLTK